MAKDITKDIAIKDVTVDDIGDTVADQIASLRAEVEKISSSLRDRGFDLLDEAGEQFDDFAEGTRRQALTAVRQVKHEAVAVADAVMEHPVSSAAAATTFIGIGIAIGYLLGATSIEKRRFHW
ncbi:hypothetical protein [Devosia sp.]|uniref:hypothetical protein n=1 Tax=Devosia sp. TaxID=1871048 RepID=UPI0032660E7C